MKKRIKMNWSTVLLGIIFLVGLCLLLYPTVADTWNTLQTGIAGQYYQQQVASLTREDYEQLWTDAKNYNEELLSNPGRFNMTDQEKETYMKLMSVPGTDIIARVRIPSLNISLPVVHTTDKSVLQNYIGHLEGSSLPVGGESTHSVLSGHRGLPSAKLFTDLPKLIEGDYFIIEVLDQTLTYQVDKISTILPEDYSNLQIEEGKDLVTLMTCTPYGVNSHRLLVRGHRVDNLDDSMLTRNDANIVDSRIEAAIIMVVFLVIISGWSSYWNRRRRKIRQKYFNEEK